MKIVFSPSGLKTTVKANTTVLAAAQSAGVAIRSLCGGNGQCQQCWVEMSNGKHAKFKIDSKPEHLSEISKVEYDFIQHNKGYANRRLACQTRIQGDLVVDVPDTSQEHQPYIAKKNKAINYHCDSKIRIYNLELETATLNNNLSASENLTKQLAKQGVRATLEWTQLAGLQKLIAKTKGKLMVVVRDESSVIAIYQQKKIKVYGAAIDIGSTTLAIYLYNLATGELVYENSAMNPQIRYGEDLMSRVSYVMLNSDGQKTLTQAIRHKLELLLIESCRQLDIELMYMLELSVVGNPIMHHLFLGLSPIELGQAPFTLTTRDWIEIGAHDIGLCGLDKNTRVSLLPLIAGHVGADTSAAYLSVREQMHTHTTLMVDIGTNAEIMLSHQGRIYATSSPTGPAFEGAEISSGVRASYGAIERIRISPKTFEVRYKQIGDDVWSDEPNFKSIAITGLCGSGIIEAIVALAECGLIDQGGLFVDSALKQRFDKKDGVMLRFLLIDGAQPVYIEQVDIRSIQLAKAALSAGVSLLMDHLDCKTFDKVLLAGAFGAHLNPYYVAKLNIIPGAREEQITSIGNAAGVGASMALLDKKIKNNLITQIQKVVKIESANEPKFQQYFVDAMQFSASTVTANKHLRKRNRRTANG